MPKVLLKTDQLENFSKSGKCLKLEKKKLKNSNVKPTVIRVIDWVSCRISNNRFTVLAVETFKLASLIKRTSNVQERLST